MAKIDEAPNNEAVLAIVKNHIETEKGNESKFSLKTYLKEFMAAVQSTPVEEKKNHSPKPRRGF